MGKIWWVARFLYIFQNPCHLYIANRSLRHVNSRSVQSLEMKHNSGIWLFFFFCHPPIVTKSLFFICQEVTWFKIFLDGQGRWHGSYSVQKSIHFFQSQEARMRNSFWHQWKGLNSQVSGSMNKESNGSTENPLCLLSLLSYPDLWDWGHLGGKAGFSLGGSTYLPLNWTWPGVSEMDEQEGILTYVMQRECEIQTGSKRLVVLSKSKF